jgi:hypothetical protein
MSLISRPDNFFSSILGFSDIVFSVVSDMLVDSEEPVMTLLNLEIFRLNLECLWLYCD